MNERDLRVKVKMTISVPENGNSISSSDIKYDKSTVIPKIINIIISSGNKICKCYQMCFTILKMLNIILCKGVGSVEDSEVETGGGEVTTTTTTTGGNQKGQHQ